MEQKVQGKYNAHFERPSGAKITFGDDDPVQFEKRVNTFAKVWGVDSLMWMKEWHD